MQRANYIPISSSPFYRIGRKRDLAELLNIDSTELKALSTDENYKEWTKKIPGKKDRIIEQPVPALESVLKRAYKLLSRVETPVWLMSGKKQIRPQDNANRHASNFYMITVDIEKFYQSTKREYVYTTFKKIFEQTSDVASALASLLTYKGHIPTGTATSQLVAFWAYKPTFERMYKLASNNDITMSIWVDDITFSSRKPFPRNWVRDIRTIAREVGLSLKEKKTKCYSRKDFKLVTGSAITPDGKLTVKNQKRKEIIDLLQGKRIEELEIKDARSLSGKVNAQRQNDPNFFNVVSSRLKVRLRHLERRSRKSI